LILLWTPLPTPACAASATPGGLPFNYKVEVYRDKSGEIAVFSVHLEQPFLAEEFDRSNYLRLRSQDERAYLIYPKETTFQQKHAEFYGRLRGKGAVKLQLSHETVAENPDGSRQVQLHQGEIEVAIPAEPTGPESIYQQWARKQNEHLAGLLRYYPEESFFHYCLLQSHDRYGVVLPPLPRLRHDRTKLETDLYQFVTGSTAIQDALQYEALSGSGRQGDLNIHISTIAPPVLASLPYKDLLETKRIRDKTEPKVAEIARLVPEDQYFLQFNSVDALDEVVDLTTQWGGSLLRLLTVQAEDQRLEAKLQEQLCLRREALARLFADAVIDELALTGADTFVHEGSDLTIILRLRQPEIFRKAAAAWVDEARKAHADLAEAEFNYRGHKIAARYTNDRGVSCFVAEHKNYVIYSNSHRAIRRCLDAAAGISPSLYESLDYRYVSTILPPAAAPHAGYFFVSEAMIRRLVGPAAKISEKRRLQCFNNLVMLNNASLMYRMEYGRSPRSLSDLVEGRFIDPAKIVCPHGGAYAFDAAHDACTCSLHNRLKYLTPNTELTVLNVSHSEAAEYERYKQRYQAFWQGAFDPVAIRIGMERRVKLETCLLPTANGGLYEEVRAMLDKTPRAIGTARFAPSAVASLVLVPGRAQIAAQLRNLPGVDEVLKANPTLTDLAWLGDRVSIHFCDGQSIVEVDPVKVQPLEVPFLGKLGLQGQALAGGLLLALKLPVYATIDVDSREKAAQLLEKLSHEVVLKGADLGGVSITADAYRLPDYQQHPMYVFCVQVYAVKLRLHVAVVGDQLVLATKPETLREVIDVAGAKEPPSPSAHLLLRLSRGGLRRAFDDVQLYWEEKARAACHRNISPIYNLVKLYGVAVEDVPRLSQAKYGVRYFCPDGGRYEFDAGRDEVSCSVHGNREHARQCPGLGEKTAFTRFIDSLDEVTASLRFQEDALLGTIEIVRSQPAKK
jgi:hypothetical protein